MLAGTIGFLILLTVTAVTGQMPAAGICLIPKITNGRVTANGIIFRNVDENTSVPQGTMIALICDAGYRLTGGVRTSVCTINRQWSVTLGKCVLRNEQVTTSSKAAAGPPNPASSINSTTTEQITTSAVKRRLTTRKVPEIFSSTSPATTTVPYDPLTCGLRSIRSKRGSVRYKIYGGSPASYPWMTRIELINFGPPPVVQMFGGTLVSPTWVLTTANRFMGGNIAKIGLFFGSSYRRYNPTLGSLNQLEFKQKAVVVHPLFNRDDPFSYNFALIQFEASSPLGPNVRPICLPDYPTALCDQLQYQKNATRIDSCDQVIASGWGVTEMARDVFPNELRDVTLKVWSYNDCKVQASDLSNYEFCAGGDPGKDTCKGDSGGPAMCIKNDRFYLMGITSSSPSEGCGVKGIPSIYGRVCSVLSWIHETIDNTK